MTRAAEQVTALAALGVRLAIAPDGGLAYEAPGDIDLAELVEYLRGNKAELLEHLSRATPAEPTGQDPTPVREATPPGYGFTTKGHVVELPRSLALDRRDPVRLIAGVGWQAWRPVTEADRRFILGPARRPRPGPGAPP